MIFLQMLPRFCKFWPITIARNIDECCHEAKLYLIFMLQSDCVDKSQLFASMHKEAQRRMTEPLY